MMFQRIANLCIPSGTVKLTLPSVQAAPLTNGDFSDSPDFNGWAGYLYDWNNFVETDNIDPSTDSHFSLPGGGLAQIETADDPGNFVDPFYAEGQLYQVFDLPSTNVEISFDYAWTGSDPANDLFNFTLFQDSDQNNFFDLLAGAGVDPTSNATGSGSASVTLNATGFTDGYLEISSLSADAFGDLFQIGNIVITDLNAQPAPSPGALLLMLAALPGLALRRRRSAT